MLRKRIQCQAALDQYTQAAHAFAEVNYIPAHVNNRQIIRWSSHASAAALLNTAVNVRASTSPAKATDTPLGKPIRH